MNVLLIIMLVFAIIGAFDRIIGNKFGLGAEFEKGFMLLGNMALTMIGVIVLAPAIATYASPVFDAISGAIGLDPSVLAASILANDSGGTPLALAIMKDPAMGGYNALVISSMMGCTISYTIPYALGVVNKEHYSDMFLGILCGIVTIPIGSYISGLLIGLDPLLLLYNLAPLFVLSIIIAIGLFFAQKITIKIFYIIGIIMKIIITVGLVIGMIEIVLGISIIPKSADMMASMGIPTGMELIEYGGIICLNGSIVLCGAFPLMAIVSRLLKRPLGFFGRKLGVNEQSTVGLITTIVSSTPTFAMVNGMDRRGIIINSAFAISAAFTFGGHLAFTMAIDPEYVFPMIIAKLISGMFAFLLALPIAAKAVKGDKENSLDTGK